MHFYGENMNFEKISDLQKKRAVNIIWNSAGDYSFIPDFKAYDENGKAELYFNSIVGAVRKHYDYPKIEKLFRGIRKYQDSDLYESILWLALENAVYGREVQSRPALKSLREAYAENWLKASSDDTYQLYDHISRAHFTRILGRQQKLNGYDAALLSELEPGPELDTDELVKKLDALLQRWFQINTEERKARNLLGVLRDQREARRKKPRYRRFGRGFADHPDAMYGERSEMETERPNSFFSRLTEEELREFIRFKYGRPLYTPTAEREIEKQLCTDHHALCHLHFTKGEAYQGSIQNAFEALQKQKEERQKEKNRTFYDEHLSANRTAIARLTAKIQNSVLLYLQADSVRSLSGTLSGGKAWRAEVLEDGKIFERKERDAAGELSVDILLDASTSQKKRQEVIASQGYIIAESLNRCGIPCRVVSFCSMTGYTILTVFRDYQETSQNARIFDYVSNGCNRDGLAIRAMHDRMMLSPYEHKLLIILSDVKPNDVSRMPGLGEEQFIDYNGDPGVADTAAEVRRARADGISVICVFTGEDEDIRSAKLVYGNDFARIQSVDQLAETVGKLILSCIRNL